MFGNFCSKKKFFLMGVKWDHCTKNRECACLSLREWLKRGDSGRKSDHRRKNDNWNTRKIVYDLGEEWLALMCFRSWLLFRES